MKYRSTRGAARVLAFDDVLLAGLAEDGGLYMPAKWPRLAPEDLRGMAGLGYAGIAHRVVRPFVGGALPDDRLGAIVEDTYRGFGHPAVAPLRQLDTGDWLLELFHGPTLAFKDYALQLVGRLLGEVLARRGERATIVGATSGDTGSAAIEACRGRDGVDVFILFPEGRVSDIQRRQMTTVADANVHAVAVQGTFDDCQDIVKALLGDAAFRERHRLSAANSINWARIMAQTVYYVAAAVRLGAPDRAVAFSVPTGNFGNVFAGWAAMRCGLPVDHLVVGTNRNDILFRFFETGAMEVAEVAPTISPSMDIQISSNFERLLFELFERDGAAVGGWMARFRAEGAAALDDARLRRARGWFSAARLDDDETRRVMRETHERTGLLLDPHSAVGLGAARRWRRRDPATPVVCLATAHPAKFPDAVHAATGRRPEPPERLAGVLGLEERFTTLPASVDAVRELVAAGGARR